MSERLLVCVCVLASIPLNGQTDNHAHGMTIRSIVFRNADVLSAGERREITKKIRQDGVAWANQSPDGVSRVADLAEERVRAAFQNEGYFKVKVSAAAELVISNTENRQFDVVVKVLDYGQRYTLHEAHFINAKAFSEAELLKLIPVQPGEIFSRAKIATGLEALRQRYEGAGYINFTSIPNTEFDEAGASVRLNIDVDEGKLFRWGDLHITGLDARKTQKLADGWEDLAGKPYSPEALREFCAKFFPAARGTDPAKYTRREANVRMGTVDVFIEFVSPWWISN